MVEQIKVPLTSSQDLEKMTELFVEENEALNIIGDTREKAIDLAKRAAYEDDRNNYEEASRLYENAVEHLLYALKYETENDGKAKIRTKCKEYLDRAEKLRKYCVLYNKEPWVLEKNMESYISNTPPDCTLYSNENYSVIIHKELLFQTKYLRSMVQSLNCNFSCDKIDIICPSLSKEELNLLVIFLYKGYANCENEKALLYLSENLSKLFGFPQVHQQQDERFELSLKVEPVLTEQDEIEKVFIKTEVEESNQKDVSYFNLIFLSWSEACSSF